MNKLYILLLLTALIIPFFAELKYSLVPLALIVFIFHVHFLATAWLFGWRRAEKRFKEENAEFIRNGQFGDNWKDYEN
jgi:hypothetical protein